MENKNSVLITIIVVAILLIAVVGATFAYFIASSSGVSGSASGNVDVSTAAEGASLVLNVATIKGSNNIFYPGTMNFIGATATAEFEEGNVPSDGKDYNINYVLSGSVTLGEAFSFPVIWKLYESTTSVATPVTCQAVTAYTPVDGTAIENTKTQKCTLASTLSTLTPVKEGTISAGTLSSIVSYNGTVGTNGSGKGDTKYYYLVVEYPEQGKDQNADAIGKSINIAIDSIELDKIELGGSGKTVQDIIADSNPKKITPDFSQASTTDEGVFEYPDPMYEENARAYSKTYYWRGAATDNYVKFGGFCWRIIRINGDGTIRMIYDGKTCHANGTSTAESIAVASVVYNEYDSKQADSSHVGWTYETGSQRPIDNTTATPSNTKTELEKWYNVNLKRYEDYIADGKFCNDRNSDKWPPFYYAAYERMENGTPSLDCNAGDIYTLKVGLITLDEVLLAGGQWIVKNDSYYLYNGQQWWTMTPCDKEEREVAGFLIMNDGSFHRGFVSNALGLRPVINLKADTKFIEGGNGTLNNPYVVI